MKKNIKLVLQYDGSDYAGWQIQKREKTVQGLIEEAIFVVTEERVRISAAGRTDAGVHALAQVAAFTSASSLGPETIKRAINANLPHDIRVLDATECSPEFHPRFSAKSKTYTYNISLNDSYSVFLRRYSWQLSCRLLRNVRKMRVQGAVQRMLSEK
jgi:tRNA pseudouridine38-40 synthase